MPDLLPADVVGSKIYGQKTGDFRFEPGPVFGNVVLVDGINRAPAKVQSALLEAMKERQVTVGGTTHPLPRLFLVMATQNPIEQEGTYPLPEARLDRFLMKVSVDYPPAGDERAILRLYPDPPLLQDHSDRGVLHARRRARAAFVPERPGPVTLPGFAVSWFDPRSNRLRQMTAEPLHLEVLPAATAPAAPGAPPWTRGILAALVVAAAAVLAWLLLRRRRPRTPPELTILAAVTSLYRWADGLTPPGGDRSIRHPAERAAVPAPAAEATALEARLYGGGPATAWNGAALLAAARKAARALHRHAMAPRGTPLPPLNPGGLASPPPRLTQPHWVR